MRLPPPPPAVRRTDGRGPRPAVAPPPPHEVAAAQALAGDAPRLLRGSRAFRGLPPAQQSAILRDLGTIHHALSGGPTATSLGTPLDFRRSGPTPTDGTDTAPAPPVAGDDANPPAAGTPATRGAATETIARRAGALSDEVDFPDFVASLVHGTFDAIVDSSIRQMEAFADLVSSVAKSTEDFTRDNVTANQARDWLVQQYPKDLALDLADGPKVVPRAKPDDDAEGGPSPGWLSDFDLDGEQLTPELIEEQLVPKARDRVGQNRLQMLATMVLLGLNRVVVRDGSISATLLFRAIAADKAKVDYAVSDDPTGGSGWGDRGSPTYALPSMKVSTVGVNVQSTSNLDVRVTGDVRINFVSETLPLDRFADDARRRLLERHARPTAAAPAAASAVAPSFAVAPASATPAPPVTGAAPPPTPAAAPSPAAAHA